MVPTGRHANNLAAWTGTHLGRTRYPAVVIPLVTSSWMMLQRNLLCTGITRARQLVVLAGSRRALAAAIRTKGAGRRHTTIAHRLHSQRIP